MTLNEYIIGNAGHKIGNEFWHLFGSIEVFFSIVSPNDSLKDGPLINSSNLELQMQTASMNIGHMAIFYTSKEDNRLSDRFAGLPLIKAAEMIFESPEVDGILIQSDGDAWFAVDRKNLKYMLKRENLTWMFSK